MKDNDKSTDTMTDKQKIGDIITEKDVTERILITKEVTTEKEEGIIVEEMAEKDKMMDKETNMEKDKLTDQGQVMDDVEKQLESTTLDEFSVESFEPTNTHQQQSVQVEEITQGQKQGKNILKFFFQRWYRAFYKFVQAKSAYGGSILGSSRFTLLPQLPLNLMLNLKLSNSTKNNQLALLILIRDTLYDFKYTPNSNSITLLSLGD